MSERRELWIVAYDIVEDRVRAQIADELLELGVRVQGSVFELRLRKSAATRLFTRLRGLALLGDSLRMYRVPRAAMSDIRTEGGPPRPEAEDGFVLL